MFKGSTSTATYHVNVMLMDKKWQRMISKDLFFNMIKKKRKYLSILFFPVNKCVFNPNSICWNRVLAEIQGEFSKWGQFFSTSASVTQPSDKPVSSINVYWGPTVCQALSCSLRSSQVRQEPNRWHWCVTAGKIPLLFWIHELLYKMNCDWAHCAVC